ncbi:MAG TPA: urea carboxylase-associated family protein [Chloroflexota bacterium]|nr:urea carboxylase-associated family protein [Chloroflexota bacterium]
MSLLQDVTVPANSGAAFEVKEGQTLTVHGQTIVDLVAFDLHDLTHRFDQARTKANLGKFYVTTGDVLVSKLNKDLLRIVEDTFTEGHHDLQYGMCSRERWLWSLRDPKRSATYYLREGTVTADDFPDHGCYENLTAALASYGVPGVDIPAPINLWQHMEMDCRTGEMRRSKLRPKEPARFGLLALMDCLVAMSACPDLAVGGKSIRVTVED